MPYTPSSPVMASPPSAQDHSNDNSPWPSTPWTLRHDPVSEQLIVYCVWKSAPPGLKAMFTNAMRDSDAELKASIQTAKDYAEAGEPNESISCEEAALGGQFKAEDEPVIDDFKSYREADIPLDRRAGTSDESTSCEVDDIQGRFKAAFEIDNANSCKEKETWASNSDEYIIGSGGLRQERFRAARMRGRILTGAGI